MKKFHPKVAFSFAIFIYYLKDAFQHIKQFMHMYVYAFWYSLIAINFDRYSLARHSQRKKNQRRQAHTLATYNSIKFL